jgi:betaine-aldehyde dehydrogenase
MAAKVDRPHIGLPTSPRRFQQFIGGRWVDGSSTGEHLRESPAHGIVVSIVPKGSAADVDAAVAAARKAFDDGRWSRRSGAERSTVLSKAADLIRAHRDELALLETLETGKPITQSRGEVDGAAGIWDYAAGQARAVHGDTFDNLGQSLFGVVIREPIGVVGIITPWNFPFFILAERLPFVLAAGCTVVLKPSENTSGTTLRMASLLEEAGLPDGVVNVVTGLGPEVGQALTEHMDVDMVSFTGSTNVGRSTLIASSKNIKKVGLELGGKNPHIVFSDADLDAAADAIVFGITFNAGQCCVSGSRAVVDSSVARSLTDKISTLASRVRVGDPLNERTQVGAIVDQRQFDKILGYVSAGTRAGATLACGGRRFGDGPGLFIEPTIFEGVTENMEIARDEIFGPVLSVMTFDSEAEAVRLANATEYGLAASIWTKNLDRALTTVRGVKAGRVWVNTTLAGGPEMPVGGFKQSGIGRDTGRHGIEEYTKVKSVNIQIGPRTPWVTD